MLRVLETTERAAIGSLGEINSSQSTFSSSCGGNGYAQSLQDLAKVPSGTTQGFISSELSANSVIREGYIIIVMAGAEGHTVTPASQTCNDSAADAVSHYFAEAHPVRVGETGQRSFATDARGTIYFSATGQAITPDLAGASVLQ